MPTAEFASTEVVMEIIVCNPTNTECNVTRSVSRPVKPAEVFTMGTG